jgi:predicted glycosyltransferase
MMRFELLPLLETAQACANRPLLISSIRDILQPKTKPGRNQEICDLIDRFYDHVLVHGDENLVRLEHSFSLASRISEKISYTGYIGNLNHASPPRGEGFGEVVVSAGGSATGVEILKTAIAARPLSCFDKLVWRLLVSPAICENQFQALQAIAGDGIILQRNRSDFTGLLQRARFSISQAGYNTITDILQSNTAACVIPYAEADEVEQTIRARRLQDKGRLVMLEESQLSPASLAAAMQQATLLEAAIPPVKLDGARQSAVYLEQWLATC